MNNLDDAITIKPINNKQLFRCNFTQFANSNVLFHRPHQNSGPTTLPTHPNFTMYNQDNFQLNDERLNDGRLSQLNKVNDKKLGFIPLPPPMPNHHMMNNSRDHPSLLINNTYTIKRELKNNHHCLANNETNSLNYLGALNNQNQNLKLNKKIKLDKSSYQVNSNPIVGQFENNLNNLTTNFNLNNNFNNQTQASIYPQEEENQEANNSMPDFQQQQADMQPSLSNNFFSLPYQQVNYPFNQETCVKQYPAQQHASLTVDRQQNQRANCVNNHCHSSNYLIKNSLPFLNASNQDFNQINQSDNFNATNALSNSIEDLRNDASSKQQQIDSLQPNLISALRTSISSEKQRLYKEQLRNELAMKLKIKNNLKSQASNLSNYFYRKKPKYKFFSQLYFLFHISFTLCLFKVSEIDKENQKIYGEILNFYYGYLLATAILFLLVQMCCKNINLNGSKEFKSQNTSIVSFGCISLGLVQLITVGLDLVNCINSELLFLPVLQFTFVFLLMHFILTTQTKESNKYFYNNVAISHLFLAQMSIWLGHFRQRGTNCGYFQTSTFNDLQNLPKLYMKPESSLLDEKLLLNDTLADDTKQIATTILSAANSTMKSFDKLKALESTINPIQIATVAAIQFATNATSTFSDLLMPIIHHFQILTVFILISIWINNNRTKVNYQRTRLCETESVNCFNDQEFASNNFLNSPSKLKSIKGLFLGLLVLSTTIVVLTTQNDYLLISTHSMIQLICVLITSFAILVKGRRRKGLQRLHQIVNLDEFHLFVCTSLICAYFCSFSAILLNLNQKTIILENLIDSLLLTIQITLQTILLRSDGRKIDKLRDIHAFLIFANFSLWILEITEIASLNGTNYNLFNLNVLPQIIVSLNRFYSSLLCIHYWKAK